MPVLTEFARKSSLIAPETLRAARWFAGKDRSIATTEIAEEFAVPAGNGWRLLLVDVLYEPDGRERYLVADAGGREPEAGDGFWRGLVRALAGGALPGRHGGRLQLRAGPALSGLSLEGPELVPSTDQTNTLVAVGEVLVKTYRRPAAGTHPEVEVCAALAHRGAPVPAFAGSLHHVDAAGGDAAVGLLQQFVAGAEGGWEGPIRRAVSALEAGASGAAAGTDEYAAAGTVAARLHEEMAAAFGLRTPAAGDGARRRRAAEARLDEAVALDAHIAPLAAAARDRLGDLERCPVTSVGRIHGDLHYAQYLRTPTRQLVVDFEGDPLLALDDRRAFDTPLHDLACLLRSVDHIGRAAARRTGRDASAWIAASRGVALGAYEEAGGSTGDARLLTALEVAKECGELVYAQRVVPEWAYAPRQGLRRLLEEPAR